MHTYIYISATSKNYYPSSPLSPAPIFSEENWDDDEEEAFELPSVEAGSKLDRWNALIMFDITVYQVISEG